MAKTTLEEGENVDITVTIENSMSFTVWTLVPPDPRLGSLDFRIRREPAQTNKLGEKSVKRHPYWGARFALEAGHSRDFALLLFSGEGPGWLEPGTYRLQVLYRSGRDDKLAFARQEEIDWDATLVSNEVRLTITAAPPERKQAFDRIKSVLGDDGFFFDYAESKPEPDGTRTLGPYHTDLPFMEKQFQAVLATKPGPSLEKQIRWAFARCLLGRGRDRSDCRERGLRELETLAGMDPTPAEKALFLTRLGAAYVEDSQYTAKTPEEAVGFIKKALPFLRAAGTLQSEFLLKATREHQPPWPLDEPPATPSAATPPESKPEGKVGSPAPKAESKVSLTLYVRDPAIPEGEVSAIVLEITNGTDKVCHIARQALYERDVIIPPGVNYVPPMVSREERPRTGVLEPRVKIHVPLESELRFIGIRHPPEGQLEVEPGQTGFLKIDLPGDAFAPGMCKIEAALYDGPDVKARSQSVEIECLPQKPKGKS